MSNDTKNCDIGLTGLESVNFNKKGNINYQTLIHCIKVSVGYDQTRKICPVVLWCANFYQHNWQKKKDKQRLKKKTKDRATRIPLKLGLTRILRKGQQFLLHMSHPFLTYVTHLIRKSVSFCLLKNNYKVDEGFKLSMREVLYFSSIKCLTCAWPWK